MHFWSKNRLSVFKLIFHTNYYTQADRVMESIDNNPSYNQAIENRQPRLIKITRHVGIIQV